MVDQADHLTGNSGHFRRRLLGGRGLGGGGGLGLDRWVVCLMFKEGETAAAVLGGREGLASRIDPSALRRAAHLHLVSQRNKEKLFVCPTLLQERPGV